MLIKTSINSEILGKTMKLAVYCPDGYQEVKLPVLYFLHGRSGSEELLEWLGMDRLADELIGRGEIRPLIIACPALDNSRGINSSDVCREIAGQHGTVNLGPYEVYLLQEFLPWVEGRFGSVRERANRYIGGISSGGYVGGRLLSPNFPMQARWLQCL